MERETLVVQNCEDVFLTHEQQLVVGNLEGLAGPGGEQHAVADSDLQLAASSVVEQLAVADRLDHATGGLLFGRVGQHDAAGGPRLALLTSHDDTVAKRLELYVGFGGLLLFGHGRHASHSSEANEYCESELRPVVAMCRFVGTGKCGLRR